MGPEEGQKYTVLRDFEDSGALLKENETIIITTIKIKEDRIFIDVLDSYKSWVLHEQSINENCVLVLPVNTKLVPEETREEKIQIKRYSKKEFKTMLKNMIGRVA